MRLLILFQFWQDFFCFETGYQYVVMDSPGTPYVD